MGIYDLNMFMLFVSNRQIMISVFSVGTQWQFPA